jgi:hypothetical protein
MATIAQRLLAQVVPAANKLWYFTSSSAAALASVGAFGLTVMALSTFSQLGTGFVGSGANQYLQGNGTWADPNSVDLQFGDGSDGAAVFDGVGAVTGFTLAGSTYTATTAKFFQWTNCTISNNVNVKVTGCPILINGTLTMNGVSSIHANGNAASADTGGAASHSLGSTWLYPGPAGGNGRTTSGNGSTGGGNTANTTAFGGAGGAGGNATNTGGAASTPTFYTEARGSLAFVCDRYIARAMPVTFTALIGGAGGGGGAGIFTVATGASGGGGGAGGVCIIKARNLVGSATTAISSNGGMGANGSISGTTGGVGGGGGGGAGFVGVIADTITGAVAFRADGGNGGDGATIGVSSANGGGAGSGGIVYVVYRTTSTAITTSVAAGTAGAAGAGGGSAGANGSAGTAITCDV